MAEGQQVPLAQLLHTHLNIWTCFSASAVSMRPECKGVVRAGHVLVSVARSLAASSRNRTAGNSNGRSGDVYCVPTADCERRYVSQRW